MKELLKDGQNRDIRSKDDGDARFVHKVLTSTFYGYENHLAMTEERMIAGISVTHRGAPDGQELQMYLTAFVANIKRITKLTELVTQ